MIEVVKPKRGELREAGELLGVETVDRTGLVVTSEGAFVRIFTVSPVNPLLMSGEEREKAAGTFQRLISQLHADERIQIVVEGRPVNLDELVGESGVRLRRARARPRAASGPRAIRCRCRAVALAAARGARGIAAIACRQPGGSGGQPLRGGSAAAATARRPRSARLRAAREAADGSA